jgi:diguanylate cyclase (GGDEF)-like protein
VALDGSNAVSVVARTGHAARIERYEPAAGASTEAIRRLALSGGVAAPITIAGRLWGAVAAGLSDAAGFSADAEQRLERFAELAATAISNVQAREALIELATTDAITGLPNYRSFHEHLQAEAKRALRYGRQMSVVLLDLDKFKQINDTHGHHTGDAVLAETARRLRTQVRKGELIARIGGEEFAWLLPETDAIGAHAAAERVRHAIAAEPFDRAGAVTLSAGVCSLADSGDAAAMMRLADRALYAAKDAGRNATRRHPLDERTQSADALIEASIT